jgi:hypothetical protein
MVFGTKASIAPSESVYRLISRSLLKIPFLERVDHSLNRTLRLGFCFLGFGSAPMTSGQPGVGSVASSCALRLQFGDSDQVEGGAAEYE